MISKKKQNLPEGWTEERVRKVIAHYENQTDEERMAEIEAALAAERGLQKKTASNGVSAKKKRSRPAANRSNQVRRRA